MKTITKRQTLTSLALMLSLTAACLPPATAADGPPSAARAQSDMPPPPAPPAPLAPLPSPPWTAPHVGAAHGFGAPAGVAGVGSPAFGALRVIDEIAHLYRVGGHPENVLPFYRETLTQARDPLVRRHLRDAIAREELKPADTAAAIATLRAQLNEDLATLATRTETRNR